MKNKSHSPVTEMLSGKYKIWLMVGLAIMLVADVLACAFLWAHGIGFGYWFIPFVMAVCDLLYLLGVALSNQRFKYARLLFIVYIALTIIMCLTWMLSATLTDGLVFDNVTIAVWSILHIVGIASAIITYLYAARRIRGGRNVQFVLAIVVSCVLVLGCGVYYSIGLFSDGYFGQGTGNRPLTYEYLDNDECAVTGLVEGNETSVVVPYEFNGKKVTRVSAGVLTDGITSVTLKCDAKAAVFTDVADVSGVNNNVIINAEKSNIDAFKTALYDNAATRELGNNLRPADLAADEVYITFSYDEQAFELADKTVLPTWYGKKGDVFRLSEIKDIPYVKASDVNSDEDLYYSYNNTDKYIMASPVSDGRQINGAVITDNCVNVPVSFQRVYRVYPGASDDAMYDTKEHFAFSVVDGKKLDYKLTIADNADKILDAFDRKGFTRTMYYKTGNGSALAMPDTLKLILEDVGGDVTVMPRWKLNVPEVVVKPAEGATNNAVYGDMLSLSTSVTHPILDDLKVDYAWYENGERLDNADNSLLSQIKYTGTGRYTVEVTVSAPSITSCKATGTANTDMNVSRRPLTVNWSNEIGNNVYNDTDFDLSIALINTIDGDDVALKQSSFTMHDAKKYNFSAELSGDDADCYYIEDQYKNKSYTIKPCPVNVTWDDERSFEYNGGELIPNAYAYDLHGAPLVLTKNGAKIDVGENYQASAVVREDTNYVVSDDPANTVTFSIYPKTVDAVWGNADFEFVGTTCYPDAHFVSVNDEEVELTVTGGKTDANIINGVKTRQYIAVASSPDKNYKVSTETAEKEFTIDQHTVRIDWSSITELTYNGQPQAPTAIYLTVDHKTDRATVSGAQTNAITGDGQKYTATATIDDTNYKIESGWESKEFTIVPYEAKVVWGNTTFTYSGESQQPTATTTGVNGVNIPLVVSGAKTVAGEGYTAYADFVTADSNYRLKNSEVTFKINKKPITVSWTDLQFEYDGASHIPTHTVSGAIGNVDCAVSGSRTDAGNNYTATFTLNDDNHVVSSGATCTFRIIPQSVAVVWDNQTAFTYMGQNNPQAPTATATDKQGRTLALTINGARAAAGNGTATAALATANSNYTLTNTSKGFTVEQYSLTLTWSGTTYTYDGTEKKPSAKATAIGGESLGLTVSGAVAAGKNYTATAKITNTNYKLVNPTYSFNIDPATAEVNWSNTTLTYNGSTQAPTASIVGVDGKTINLSVTGGAVDAGNNYTATAQAPNSNYTLTNTEKPFNIGTKTVTVTVESISVAYGQTPNYKYNATGIISGDNVTVVCSVTYTADENGNIPINTYEIHVELSGTDSGNYAVYVQQSGTLTVTEQSEAEED